MKTLTLILLTASFLSCKKNYTCTCNGSSTTTNSKGLTTSSDSYQSIKTIEETKKQAKNKCKSNKVVTTYGNTTNVVIENCILK